MASIVSATKTASATATVVTDIPHGLTTSTYITLSGIRDITNFPAVTTPVVVSSVIDATTFTVVIGSSATATSFG